MTRTTVRLPDDLFADVKRRAAEQGLKLQELVAEALRAFLAQAPRAKRIPHFHVAHLGPMKGTFRRSEIYEDDLDRKWKKDS